MKVEAKKVGSELELIVEERLDTNTSPELQRIVNENMDEETETVIFNFENLEYISSTGLRVIVTVLKKPAKVDRSVIIRRPNERIVDVLRNVGLYDLLEIQD